MMTVELPSGTRRQLCLGALACALAGRASASISAPPAAAPSFPVGSALVAAGVGSWTRLVGTSFLVLGENGNTMFRLIKVEPLTGSARPRQIGRPETFMLYFEAPARQTAVRGDDSYRFSSPYTGTFNLMVSGGSATRFVAIMN